MAQSNSVRIAVLPGDGIGTEVTEVHKTDNKVTGVETSNKGHFDLDVVVDATYYKPTSLGAEAGLKERWERVRAMVRGKRG